MNMQINFWIPVWYPVVKFTNLSTPANSEFSCMWFILSLFVLIEDPYIHLYIRAQIFKHHSFSIKFITYMNYILLIITKTYRTKIQMVIIRKNLITYCFFVHFIILYIFWIIRLRNLWRFANWSPIVVYDGQIKFSNWQWRWRFCKVTSWPPPIEMIILLYLADLQFYDPYMTLFLYSTL